MQGSTLSRSINKIDGKPVGGVHTIVHSYQFVFTATGLATCGHISFHLLWPDMPVKSLNSYQEHPTVFIFNSAIKSDVYLQCFGLKKA